MATRFRFECTSGGLIAFPGDIYVFVVNPGETEEVIQVVGYRRGAQDFDSEVDIDPKEGPPNGNVRPGHMWIYHRELRLSSPSAYWILVRTTSENLVPSIEFRREEKRGGPMTTYAWHSPRDFAVFPIRFRRLNPGAVGPVNIPAVDE